MPVKHSARRGAILVISLLMLAMISSIAFVVSSLVYRNVTVERAYDDALGSYYAAESGVERALDIATRHRVVGGTISATETVVETYATSGAPHTFATSETAYWIDATVTGRGVSSYRLPVESRTQIELYNPDSSFSYLNVESLRWLWNMPSTCPATSRIEASFFKYNSTSIGRADDLVYKQVFTCGAEAAPAGYQCQATSNYPTINTNYIVSIWNMDCDLIDLTTTAYAADNAAGAVVTLPAIVQWSAIGKGQQSQRQMTATTKWVPTASGLAEFVLFGESPITK